MKLGRRGLKYICMSPIQIVKWMSVILDEIVVFSCNQNPHLFLKHPTCFHYMANKDWLLFDLNLSRDLLSILLTWSGRNKAKNLTKEMGEWPSILRVQLERGVKSFNKSSIIWTAFWNISNWYFSSAVWAGIHGRSVREFYQNELPWMNK